MKTPFRKAVDWLLPFSGSNRKTLLVFFIAIWLKFTLFNIVWCMSTTFTAFSRAELWLFSTFASLVLTIPYVYSRRNWSMYVIMVLLDLFLVANLIYFRTYNTSIPLDSYGLWGNLEDYKDNVYLSLRPSDILFFAITVVTAWVCHRLGRHRADISGREDGAGFVERSRYLLLPLTLFVIGYLIQLPVGGFINKFRSIKQSNKYVCAVPMYTVFGGLCYDLLHEKKEYGPEVAGRVGGWISVHDAAYEPAAMRGRENTIIILLESFESWPIGLTFEGKEVTPNINRLVSDSSVFYAPMVRSQVRGGRSADGSLMLNTGLLPIAQGAFSTEYAANTYPSLVWAFKERHPGAQAYVLSVDKPATWNQKVYWPSFGYDAMFGRSCFDVEDTDRTGPKMILGDVPFMKQCAERIISGEYWDRDGNNCVKIVTYSGHYPFRLPDHLARISFDSDMPGMMRDYMITANYTDHAVGQFIEMLNRAGIMENTTLIITGDHEGLADNREAIVKSDAGREVVSPGLYTPLIIVNSDAAGHYEELMGQIDIYPTLLDALGLGNYWWKGLGYSAFNPARPPIAVTPEMQLTGDTDAVSPETVEHIWDAWEVSDLIITCDYFSKNL